MARLTMEPTAKIIQWAANPRITDSAKILRQKRGILGIVTALPGPQQALIFERVIYRKNWFAIEENCNYCERQGRNILNAALEAVREGIFRAAKAGRLDADSIPEYFNL